ncbi:hypothetical protein QQ045_030044 [Rhodiola kirilowii]
MSYIPYPSSIRQEVSRRRKFNPTQRKSMSGILHKIGDSLHHHKKEDRLGDVHHESWMEALKDKLKEKMHIGHHTKKGEREGEGEGAGKRNRKRSEGESEQEEEEGGDDGGEEEDGGRFLSSVLNILGSIQSLSYLFLVYDWSKYLIVSQLAKEQILLSRV